MIQIDDIENMPDHMIFAHIAADFIKVTLSKS